MNLIVIQHQGFDVTVMYSLPEEYRWWLSLYGLAHFFCSDAGLYVMPMFGKVGLRL
jgi:hypothetical protein